MDASGMDEGTIDYAVVEFPHGTSTFGRDLVAELVRLSFEGLIRVLDLVVIQKASDGSVEGFEVQDLEGDEIRTLESDLDDVLSTRDVARLASAVSPGSVAGVVVWENLWAVPLVAAARHRGGQLLKSGRLTITGLDEATANPGN